MQENNKMLPLGSIVHLKEGTAKMLIMGRASLLANEGEKPMLFDYASVMYPIGFNGKEQIYYFNEEHIDQVLFTGFNDSDDERAQKVLADWKAENAGEYEIIKIDKPVEN